MSAPDLTSVTGNYLTAAQKGFATTLNGAITNVAVTITLGSVAGFSNGDSVFLWIDPGAATAELVFGIVATGTTQLTSVIRGIIGTASAHSNGATVAQYVSSADHQAMRKHLLVQHNQDGTHKAITAPSVTTTAAVTAGSGLVMSAGAFAPSGSWDGWVGAGESWSYSSASAITVPTDATTKYDVGDFIKITQSATVKYFVVTAVAATLLTVSGLNGVTVANSAISANAYSKTKTPHGTASIDGAGLSYNPYKFFAYRNAAWTANSGKINLDAELFDTGSNFDSTVNFRFNAPISGFYQINFAAASQQASGTGYSAYITKNVGATNVLVGSQQISGQTSSFNVVSTGSGLVQLAANDYLELQYVGGGSVTGGTGSNATYMSGFLVSAL